LEDIVKKLLLTFLSAVLAFAPTVARAQTEEEIRKTAIEDLKPWIEQEVQRRVKEAMEAAKTNAPPASVQVPVAAPPSAQAGPVESPESAKLSDQLAKELGAVSPLSQSPNRPITLVSGQGAYANLSLDVLGLMGTSSRANIGLVDPYGSGQRGFELQEAEIFIDGAVDPYFYGAGNFSFTTDNRNSTSVYVEEAFLRTLSLPWNLQVQAGQFHTAFGRLNQQHTHMWDYVDPPLVNARLFGGDLINPGVQISWLAPTPFYTAVYFTVQDSQGERQDSQAVSFLGNTPLFGRTPVDRSIHSVGDLLFVPRITSSFDLTDNQTVTVGASAAFGPNDSGSDTRTEIYGLDAYWKWKPANAHGGWPFLKWQSEAMTRRYEAGADPTAVPLPLPDETLWDWGGYTQLVWGFTSGWTAALRGDYVDGTKGAFYPDPDRDERWRISPALTWYLSEFSKIRLQYNFDEISHFGPAHSVWVQFEYVLGAHGAHPY
jgi:hypothetical protein